MTNRTFFSDFGFANPEDIVRFIPTQLGELTDGVFEQYFDGSDVGLTTSGENIDALSVLDNGDLVISTNGTANTGDVFALDQDVIRFTPTQLGAVTAGTWSLYYDGSLLDLSDNAENISAISSDAGGLFISTLGNFTVGDFSGSRDDVFICSAVFPAPTGCEFHPFWIAADFAISSFGVDALVVDGASEFVPNQPPQVQDDAYVVSFESSLNVDSLTGVLANDVDFENDPLTLTLVRDVRRGSLTLHEDGSFEYVPVEGFFGRDEFTYFVRDLISTTPIVTVSITVNPPPNEIPVSVSDAYEIAHDSVLLVTAESGVLANDTDADGDNLTAVEVSTVSTGSLTLLIDGTFVFTPSSGFSGIETFSYYATDGTDNSEITDVVIRVNAPPVAVADTYNVGFESTVAVDALTGVLSNDLDDMPETLSAVIGTNTFNGALVFRADGSFDYTPNDGFSGVDGFTYNLTDGLDTSNPVTVS